jgi:pilus assembly protein CpaE
MNAFLVSDERSPISTIRQAFRRESIDCPAEHVLSYSQAVGQLANGGAELIVAVLPHDSLRSVQALDILSEIPRDESTRVIAIGPAADPKLVIRALRGVVDDYVDINDLENELAGALASWKLKRQSAKPEGKLVAVLAPSGGSGSSTLAVNVATVLAGQHGSAALIDMKLEAGDLASLLDLKPTYTLADISQNIDRLDRVFFERALVRHDSGVHLLAPPRLLADVIGVSSEGVRQAVAMARELFPYVVVDVDHSYRDEQLQVLRPADMILLVIRLDFSALRNARRTLDHLGSLGIAMDRVRLVVNRVGQPKEVPPAKAEEALGLKIFHAIPDDPKSVNRANNNGIPVVLDAPTAKVSKSVMKLAEGINGQPDPA